MSTALEGGFGASVVGALFVGKAGASERELGFDGERADDNTSDIGGGVVDLTGTVRLGGG